MEVVLVRQYIVIKPSREKLKRKIASSALEGTPLPVTARECLDELSARRRQPEIVDFQLLVSSVHLRDGAFVIADLMEQDAVVRLDFETDRVVMTVIGSNEEPTAP